MEYDFKIGDKVSIIDQRMPKGIIAALSSLPEMFYIQLDDGYVRTCHGSWLKKLQIINEVHIQEED
jgi:hypothetical protein